MPIKPGKDEKQDAWMARCVPEMMGQDGGTKRPNEQAVAACLTMWRDDKNQKSLKTKDNGDGDGDIDIEPEEDEDYDTFMERCMDETDGDNFTCQMAWDDSDNSDKAAKQVVKKTHVSPGHGLEFILSDATPDRMGDVIEAEGWDLTDFKNNPVALFNHNPNFPIGKWANLRIADGRLRGHLQLAPEGTSDRIDEIRRLVDADILRAVSVGFLPMKSEPLKKDKSSNGMRFLQSKLVETSLVAIPANPNALAVARSLNISASTSALVFAGKGNSKTRARCVAVSTAGKPKVLQFERTGSCLLHSQRGLKRRNSG